MELNRQHIQPAAPDKGGVDERLSPDSAHLARYFRDIADASRPMTAAEEADLALQLEAAQQAVWERLLSYPLTADELVARVLQDWTRPPAQLRALRRAAVQARRARTRVARLALEKQAARNASRIRRYDRDRELLEALLDSVEKQARVAAPPGGKVAYGRWLARVREAQTRAEAMRQEFVRRNLRLVVAIARRYRNAGMALPDLVQEGNLGLMRGVDRFDVHRGFRFSTYASWWIRHAVTRALADRGRLVREPVHRIDARSRLERARRTLSAKLGRTPTTRELAKAIGLSERRVEAALRPAFEHGLSLDATRLDDDRTLHESLRDPAAEDVSPADALARQATLRQLDQALGGLRPLEVAVIRKRFGFADAEDNQRTLAEIGAEHGLSRERIRQIQEEALGKLRRSLERSERVTSRGA